MKIMALIVLSLSAVAQAQAPDTTAVRARIDSLQIQRTVLKQQLGAIEEELAGLRLELARTRVGEDSLGPVSLVMAGVGELRDSPYRSGELVGLVWAGSQVRVLAYVGDEFWRVVTDQGWGYMSSLSLPHPPELQAMRDRFEVAQAEIKANIALREAARRDEVIRKYGVRDGTRIADRKVWIGMTSAMARDSWGTPSDLNRTVTSLGVSEQWVYGSAYLYVENGVLTSWQD